MLLTVAEYHALCCQLVISFSKTRTPFIIQYWYCYVQFIWLKYEWEFIRQMQSYYSKMNWNWIKNLLHVLLLSSRDSAGEDLVLDAVAVVCVVFVLHVLHDFPRTVSSCSLAFGIIPNYINIALFSSFNTLQEAETIASYWETRWGRHGHVTRWGK